MCSRAWSRRRAHRHVVGDHRDLAFEVDAELLARHGDILVGPEKIVRAALVDERIGPEVAGISAPRALRTSSTWFTYAEPSTH